MIQQAGYDLQIVLDPVMDLLETDGTRLTMNDQCTTVVVDPPPGLRYIQATKDRTSQMKLVEMHRNCLYYPGAGG